MSPALLLKKVVAVIGKEGEAALWGMMTMRLPPERLAVLAGGQRGGKRSPTVDSSAGAAGLKAHNNSRSAVSWMNLPFTSAWLGDAQLKYNIGKAKLSTCDNNAFCMTAFLQRTELEGQSRAAFLQAFRTSQTNTKASFHKIVRNATCKFVCSLTSSAARTIRRGFANGGVDEDEVPTDPMELIVCMRRNIEHVDTSNTDFKLWLVECFRCILDAHQSPSYPDVTWNHILGTGDITKFDAPKFFLEILKETARSALSHISRVTVEGLDAESQQEAEDDLRRAELAVISQATTWSVLKKGGSTDKTFQNDFFLGLLRAWTAKKRPAHHLIGLTKQQLDEDDLVRWTRPYPHLPGFSGSASGLEPPSEDSSPPA